MQAWLANHVWHGRSGNPRKGAEQLPGLQVWAMVTNAHYLYRMTILGALAALTPAFGHDTLCNTMLPVVLSCATDKVPSVCRIHLGLPSMHTFTVLRPKLSSSFLELLGLRFRDSQLPSLSYAIARIVSISFPLMRRSQTSYLQSPSYWGA